MEIILKQEDSQDASWFYIEDLDRLRKNIDEMFPGFLDRYFQIDHDEWVAEMRAKPQLLVGYEKFKEFQRQWDEGEPNKVFLPSRVSYWGARATEEMLKGQAFGL